MSHLPLLLLTSAAAVFLNIIVAIITVVLVGAVLLIFNGFSRPPVVFFLLLLTLAAAGIYTNAVVFKKILSPMKKYLSDDTRYKRYVLFTVLSYAEVLFIAIGSKF